MNIVFITRTTAKSEEELSTEEFKNLRQLLTAVKEAKGDTISNYIIAKSENKTFKLARKESVLRNFMAMRNYSIADLEAAEIMQENKPEIH